MNRKQIILVIAATIVVSAIAFEGGRQTVVIKRMDDVRRADAKSGSLSRPNIYPSSESDHNIRLENLASISFTELYDVLHAASPEQRSNWAHQLDALPAGPRKLAAIESFYKTLVQLDAREAVRLVPEINDHRALAIAVAAVVATVREADLKLVGDMLMEFSRDTRRRMPLSRLVQEWLQVEPPTAVEFIDHHRHQFSDDELYSIVWSWSEHDPKAARQWFERLGAKQQTRSAPRGVVLGWYQRDPAAAVEYAAEHADSQVFRDVIDEIANSVVRNTPDESVDFIKEMPAFARDTLINAVIESAKVRQPINSVDDVVRWLVALPNSIWRGHVDDLLSVWEKKDAAGALSWIEELPVETRAQLLTEHCPQGNGIPRERAFALALDISDRELRDTALHKFTESLGTTRKEALNSVQTLDISAAQKRYLRSFLRPE